jgi:predicted ATP-grasp superfamily ATP-dependent carboligase
MRAVLILGGRAPVALDHARRFARLGWRVYVADSVPCRLSGWSRAVAAAVQLPPPRHGPQAFARALAAALTELRVDLLLPTCEEVFYVARHRGRLPTSTAVATDGFDKLRALHSKLEFLDLARGCGAHVPDSAPVANVGEARDWARGRPLVLKPEFSRFGVHVRLHPSGLPNDAPELARLGRWVAQEYCSGEEICSYSAAVGGRVTAHVAYRPLYRIAGSSSYYFDPITEPGIRGFVEEFVAKTSYTGQISFDWIRRADGTLAVLECNPRAISGVHLFALDDDLPNALTGDAPLGEPRAPRAAMLAGAMLTAGLASAVTAGRVGVWRRDFARARDVLCVHGDVQPFAGGVCDLGSHVIRALRRRCSVREAMTRDIEWDGEALPEW